MITIRALLKEVNEISDAGVAETILIASPETPIPQGAVKVECVGDAYNVYMPEDINV